MCVYVCICMFVCVRVCLCAPGVNVGLRLVCVCVFYVRVFARCVCFCVRARVTLRCLLSRHTSYLVLSGGGPKVTVSGFIRSLRAWREKKCKSVAAQPRRFRCACPASHPAKAPACPSTVDVHAVSSIAPHGRMFTTPCRSIAVRAELLPRVCLASANNRSISRTPAPLNVHAPARERIMGSGLEPSRFGLVRGQRRIRAA